MGRTSRVVKKADTAKQAQEAYAIQSAESEIVGGEGEGGLTPFVEQQAQQAYIDQAAADAAAKAESFGKEAFGPPQLELLQKAWKNLCHT